MSENIQISFKKKPSHITTLIKAFQARNSKLNPGQTIPTVTASTENQQIDRKHLQWFNKICGIDSSSELSLLYPFTLVYPYIMRILCSKEIPFSLFELLNTRNSIKQYRSFCINDTFDISCSNSAPRRVEKGFEIDILSHLVVKDEIVWKNCTTYLSRQGVNADIPLYEPPSISPLDEDAHVIHSWFLPAKHRLKFASVSGDTNGIHLNALYAKNFGFDRDFAQPIRVVAKCIDALVTAPINYPATLDFFLKGPVYYNNELMLKGCVGNNSHGFDLFCGENEKPCISGQLITKRF